MTMQPIPTYAEALAQLDALRAQVATLAKYVKQVEWGCWYDGSETCLCCLRDVREKHKPDCELAAALIAAGLDAEKGD